MKAEPEGGKKRCDVAVPIHNGLTYLRPCLESVIAHTEMPYGLILIDDGSDSKTEEYLAEFAAQHSHVKLLRHSQALGFVKSCNHAIGESDAEYIVLLNSDTIVTPGWLRKMTACGDSDEKIAAASPISNFCPHMRIEMLPGYNFLEMAALIEALSDRNYPDVTTPEGFCLLLRRRAVEELGAFDEIFGVGYGEESDFCMRAVAHGWRTVCVDDTYIYHKGRGSFGADTREDLYKQNSEVFRSRWLELYRRDFEDFRRRDPLGALRLRLEALRRPEWHYFQEDLPPADTRRVQRGRVSEILSWVPRPGILVANEPERRAAVGVVMKVPPLRTMAKSMVRAMRSVPEVKRKKEVMRKAAQSKKKALRVAFLLPTMRPYGGVLSVVNIINELILQGVEAKLVTMSQYKEFEHQLFTEPIFCRDREEIATVFPEVDIAVATQWETVRHILKVCELQPEAKPFYFIQDYEANFLPEHRKEEKRRVAETYVQIKHKVVKTEHLREQVSQHDPTVFKIKPGMDLDNFYQRDVADEEARARRVVCMARPATPWRGFDTLCRVLGEVHRRQPEAEFVLFGTDDLSRYEGKLEFPFSNAGMVSHRQLPALYSSCAIYCDFSRFHGFGRTGAEAMACGCACVLTSSGGVSEYAAHGKNALLCRPDDEEALTEAIVQLLVNPELRKALADNAAASVQAYSDRAAARQFHDLFLTAMRGDI